MAKLVQLFVEGKSDLTFFEGSKFRDFIALHGYSVTIKNLRTKGNVLSNFEKFLKLQGKNVYATLLVYDKDCCDFDTKRIDEILKNYKNASHYIAIQELEAWFIADHSEIKKINSNAKLLKDTQSLTNPKYWLRDLFYKAGKGYKIEMGFAAHFAGKINFAIARQYNKSLDKFLLAFENNFK